MAYIVIASTNKHKVEEYKEMLSSQDVDLQSLLDYPNCPEIEENGTTFKENSSIKAMAASKYCEAIAFADDSGLEVTALDNAPGIYSARYAPSDKERVAKLLKALEGKSDRSARFVCAIAIAFNGEIIECFEGEIKGTIAYEPKGENGFGYDPIFIPENHDLTFAELSSNEKNKISHRARAFAKALEFVEEELSVLADGF